MQIAASLRSADITNLREEIKKLEKAKIDMLHFDVSDGHFVPDIAMGPSFVKALRPVTKLPFDIHLMVEHPEMFVPQYLEAGADSLIIHIETTTEMFRLIDLIKQQKKTVGVALSPQTPVEAIKEVLPYINKVCVMTINTGYGGVLVPNAYSKVQGVHDFITKQKLRCLIEVDGAVSKNTYRHFKAAGTDIVVVGYPLFSQNNYQRALSELLK